MGEFGGTIPPFFYEGAPPLHHTLRRRIMVEIALFERRWSEARNDIGFPFL
jgi:hypothetical protein